MNFSNYRPDIDGLRAIAIFGVVFFHFNISPFSGGYLGVDVFLVISGYLITSFIIPRLKIRKFSIAQFLIRRIKRLLPSYYITIIFCLFIAFLVFDPENLNKFSKSSISSVLLYSNLFFWKSSGYWDETNTNPLLHTWSLSLEWQFYIFISFFLFLMWKINKNFFKFGLYILFFLSLTFSILYIGRDLSFFLLPFRLFEFLIGSFIFLIDKKIKIIHNYRNSFSTIGIFLIIFSFINFDSFTNVPGYISLIPCLGTALLLHLNNSFIHKILSNKIFVYLGLISYSLYLFHWPIITFYNAYNLVEISLKIKILLIVLSIVLSVINYELLEKKIRSIEFKFLSLTSILLCLIIPLFILIINFIIIKNNGLPERISTEKILYLNSFNDEIKGRTSFLKNNINLKFDKIDKIKILVLGDSHGEDMFLALNQNNDTENFDLEFLELSHWCFQKNKFKDILFFIERIQKRIKKCQDEKRNFKNKTTLLNNADYILLSSRWYKGIDKYIEEIIIYLKNLTDAEIIVSSKTIFFPRMSSILFRIEPNEINNLNKLAYKMKYKEQDQINIKLEKKVSNLKIKFLDKYKLICSDKKKLCEIFDNKNKKFYIFDGSHWTLDGAKYYGKKIDFGIFK